MNTGVESKGWWLCPSPSSLGASARLVHLVHLFFSRRGFVPFESVDLPLSLFLYLPPHEAAEGVILVFVFVGVFGKK